MNLYAYAGGNPANKKNPSGLFADTVLDSGYQTPVWLHEGALPGAQEEHGAARHSICAVKPVDGEAQVDGLYGAGTSARGVMPPRSRAIALAQCLLGVPNYPKRVLF